jgi:hypothetical protein
MTFSGPRDEINQNLRARIQEYEQVRMAASSGGEPPDCESLATAFGRVDAAAAALTVGSEGLGIERLEAEGLGIAIEEVRRDFEASGCATSD